MQATAEVDVGLPGAGWRLEVYNPEVKRQQEVAKGVIAMIVVVAFIISGTFPSVCWDGAKKYYFPMQQNKLKCSLPKAFFTNLASKCAYCICSVAGLILLYFVSTREVLQLYKEQMVCPVYCSIVSMG